MFHRARSVKQLILSPKGRQYRFFEQHGQEIPNDVLLHEENDSLLYLEEKEQKLEAEKKFTEPELELLVPKKSCPKESSSLGANYYNILPKEHQLKASLSQQLFDQLGAEGYKEYVGETYAETKEREKKVEELELEKEEKEILKEHEKGGHVKKNLEIMNEMLLGDIKTSTPEELLSQLKTTLGEYSYNDFLKENGGVDGLLADIDEEGESGDIDEEGESGFL